MSDTDRPDDLPWDKPKPDPDDLDLFAQPANDADRLVLARLEARAILEDPPPGSE